MATPLRMPDMGTVEGQVTLVRWLKAEGDAVALGEPLFEVETDKGVSEVESALAGVLVKRSVADGARVSTGDTIALIRRPGESEEEVVGAGPAGTMHGEVKRTPPKTAESRPARPRVAPTIRALADKRGVDLEAIRGSGPGGLILREDVLRARQGAPAPHAPAAGRFAPGASASGAQGLSRSQAIVASKVSQSHREKPVYHVSVAVDMTAAMARREKSKAGGADAVSFDAIFVKAVGTAIAEFPVFQAWLSGESLMRYDSADVAVAIGVGEDLSAPAVRGPGRKGVTEISGEIGELARKAEARSLGAREVEGSCFLVSNLGMFPVESFDAVIYPEHSAALAIGAITHTPVSDGKVTRVAPIARLTLSVDHRLINGRTAARFMARVKQILETGALD